MRGVVIFKAKEFNSFSAMEQTLWEFCNTSKPIHSLNMGQFTLLQREASDGTLMLFVAEGGRVLSEGEHAKD